MSAIQYYQEPQDILKKLAREGRRAWHSDSSDDVADHLFNFCITSHSLRDWCIKYKNLNAGEVHEHCNTNERLKWCRDIANSSKHFGLDRGNSTVQKVDQSVDKLVTLLPNEVVLPGLKERQSITIVKADGTTDDLMSFIFWTFSAWESIFESYGIPKSEENLKAQIFIEWV